MARVTSSPPYILSIPPPYFSLPSLSPPFPFPSPLPPPPLHSSSRYQFVTGKLPFEGDTIYKLFTSISSDELRVLPDLPEALQSLLRGEGTGTCAVML